MSKSSNSKLDYPFYKDSSVTVKDIIILLIFPIFFTIYTFLPYGYPFGLGAFIFTGCQLLAFLYVARGKISLLIKKPSFRDLMRVLWTLILQFVVSIGFAMLLKYVFNVATHDNEVFDMDMNIKFWVNIIAQLFGEELYKILLFLGTLTIMYKKTSKRTLSITIALIVSLFLFAILHTTTYNNIIQILVLQGLSSIICMYNYLKTKNILTSYLQHLLFDAIPFILAMINII